MAEGGAAGGSPSPGRRASRLDYDQCRSAGREIERVPGKHSSLASIAASLFALKIDPKDFRPDAIG